jgi:hypothetical protein
VGEVRGFSSVWDTEGRQRLDRGWGVGRGMGDGDVAGGLNADEERMTWHTEV